MSTAEWYFLQGTKEAGPFTREQIYSLFTASSIHEETLLWRPGCADWTALSAFKDFNGLPPRAALPPAPQRDEFLDIERDGQAKERSPANAPPALTPSNQWMDESPHPWRRYVARLLDNIIWGSLLLFLAVVLLAVINPSLSLEFANLVEGPGGQAAATALMHFFAVIPNALLIGLTGGNLGKWLCGICVLNESERPIGLAQAFRREGKVFLSGLGLGIPIIALFTMVHGYRTLKQNGRTNWDKALGLKIVYRRKGPAQYFVFTIAVLLLIGLIVSFVALDRALA